jgi:prepilin-type processing-associated H-X9-DG protein
LLLPAVQAAREAARRIQCARNLGQIGQALHSYHSVNNCFPIDWADYSYRPGLGLGPVPGPLQYYSSAVRLLPYLDQVPLFSSMNFTLEYFGTSPINPGNATCYGTSLGVFLCPSDSGSGLIHRRNNYRVNNGIGPSVSTTLETWDSGNGFASYPNLVTVSSFQDGLSRTAAYSERLSGSGGQARPERDFSDVGPLGIPCMSGDADLALACSRAASRVAFPAFSNAGESWILTGRLHTIYCHAQTPNGPIPDALEMEFPTGWGVATARSWHRGGVNVLMGDGSVRFVHDGIASRVWRGMSSRSGGEIVE